MSRVLEVGEARKRISTSIIMKLACCKAYSCPAEGCNVCLFETDNHLTDEQRITLEQKFEEIVDNE